MRLLGASLAVFALLLGVASLAAAEEPTQSEYVERLERICKPRTEATQRVVRGTRADVKAERMRSAARKVTKAKRIFAGTVRSMASVPRPSAYASTLARWFTALDRETAALGRTAAALRADDLARFERVWADFIREGNKANNVVVSFGFNYCDFKPSRFT